MATFHSPSILDLDNFTAFHVCVGALIICPAAMQQSTSLRVPSRLLVFSAFAILLWTGIVSFATSARFHPLPQLCFNGISAVNINDTQAITSCLSTCSQHALSMRSGQSPQNVIYNPFFYKNHYKVTYVITCVLTGSLVLGFIAANSATPSEQFNAHYSAADRRRMNPHERKTKMKPYGFVQKITMIGLFAWLVFALIALAGLPQSENGDAIGQWRPVVAFVLVGAGSCVQKFMDEGEETDGSSKTELGKLRGAQTTGLPGEARRQVSMTRSTSAVLHDEESGKGETGEQVRRRNDCMFDDEGCGIGLSKRTMV